MPSVASIFCELTFDVVHDFEVVLPDSLQLYPGPHADIPGPVKEYIRKPFVGFKEYFSLFYGQCSRDPETGQCRDPVFCSEHQKYAKHYINKFKSPKRISLMCPGQHGWFEAVVAFGKTREGWKQLVKNFRDCQALHPNAFICISNTIYDTDMGELF